MQDDLSDTENINIWFEKDPDAMWSERQVLFDIVFDVASSKISFGVRDSSRTTDTVEFAFDSNTMFKLETTASTNKSKKTSTYNLRVSSSKTNNKVGFSSLKPISKTISL